MKMVKTGLFVFIVVSAILINLSESALIPFKENTKLIVISETEAKGYVIIPKEDMKIPEKSEIASKEEAKVPDNSETAPKENTRIPEVSVIVSNDPKAQSNPAVLAVAEPHPEIILPAVKPVIAAVKIDAETAEFLEVHSDLTYIGTDGGKYYYYQEVYRDYESAKGVCEAAGLTLVEINTVAEAEFLYPRTPAVFLWTSDESIDNFKLAVSGHPLTVNVDRLTHVRLQFDSTISDTSKQMFAKLTTAKAYPLCQKLISASPVKEDSKSC